MARMTTTAECAICGRTDRPLAEFPGAGLLCPKCGDGWLNELQARDAEAAYEYERAAASPYWCGACQEPHRDCRL